MISDAPEQAQSMITILDEDRKRIEAKEEANQISWIGREREILDRINEIYATGYSRGLTTKTGLELTTNEKTMK